MFADQRCKWDSSTNGIARWYTTGSVMHFGISILRSGFFSGNQSALAIQKIIHYCIVSDWVIKSLRFSQATILNRMHRNTSKHVRKGQDYRIYHLTHKKKKTPTKPIKEETVTSRKRWRLLWKKLGWMLTAQIWF
jgi:hypothetical protein